MTVRISDPHPLQCFPPSARRVLGELALPRGHMRSLLRRRPAAALVVVAIADEAVTVGWASAERRGRRYLLAVYVRRGWRRRGIGGELLEAIQRAAAARWPRSEALALPWSTAGRALYRAAGFERRVA